MFLQMAFHLALFATLVFIASAHGQVVSTTLMPSPTGRFIVGRTVLFWTDETRHEEGLPQRDVARELAAFVYYPTSVRTNYADYYPGLRDIKERDRCSIVFRKS